MKKIDLIIFDLVGTTIQDRGEVETAFLAAFNSQQIEILPSDIVQYRGRSKREAIRHLLNKKYDNRDDRKRQLEDKIYAEFQLLLEDQYRTKGVLPIAGAEELFYRLREHGVKIAITTGFSRRLMKIILDRLHWNNIIDAKVCADDVKQGRPAPDMIQKAMEQTNCTDAKRVIKIGDTSNDIKAGQRAGAGCTIGVLSGSHDISSLKEANPDFIIASVADLWNLLQKKPFGFLEK